MNERLLRRFATGLRAIVLLTSVALVAVILGARSGPSSGSPAARPRFSDSPPVALRSTPTTTSPATVSTVATLPSTVAPSPKPTDVPVRPLPPTISRVATRDPVVFLTIDDGYVRDAAVADRITQAHLPVSLFLVGSAARAGTPYFERLRAAGATVQDHTLTHPQLKGMSVAAQTSEICGSATLDGQLFGAAPSLFRPPYGAYDANTALAATRCGFATMVLWQATVNDGVLRIQGRTHLMAGDIILMHFRTDLAVNLNIVLAQVAADGLRVGRLEDYLS